MMVSSQSQNNVSILKLIVPLVSVIEFLTHFLNMVFLRAIHSQFVKSRKNSFFSFFFAQISASIFVIVEKSLIFTIIPHLLFKKHIVCCVYDFLTSKSCLNQIQAFPFLAFPFLGLPYIAFLAFPFLAFPFLAFLLIRGILIREILIGDNHLEGIRPVEGILLVKGILAREIPIKDILLIEDILPEGILAGEIPVEDILLKGILLVEGNHFEDIHFEGIHLVSKDYFRSF